MRDEIAALTARLGAAEDRLALYDLEGEYARSWDAGDASGWAALFTPDGEFVMPAFGGVPAQTYAGTAALVSFCEDVNRYYRGLHFISLPRIVLDGDRARAQVHFQWLGLFRPGAVHSGERHARGYYDVTYRRDDGRWRMTRRVEVQIAGATTEAFDPFVKVDLAV